MRMTLLERERSLQDLTQWLDTAVHQGGLVALVEGEAGIGKTSLLQAFAAAQRLAPRVLWGGCDALLTPRPLAPLHDIARQTQQALLAAILAGNRDAIFTATLDELERQPPAVMVLEDLHWADDATLDLLKFLGRRVARTRALLVVTYRDDELGPRHPLRSVIGDLPRASLRRLHLTPLSEGAVLTLAQEAGRSAPDLHAATGGNPFFVTEVLASDSGAVPASVSDAVLARAMRLPPAAREIAELVSTVPGRCESWLLQAFAPDPDAMEYCLGIGMVRGEDGSLSFRHELARRALEGSLLQTRRQGLHARVLEILAARAEVSAARLAHHADGAHDTTAVLRWAPLAAEQAARVGARREAAAHYRLALRYASQHLAPEEIARLHEGLSYECYLTEQMEAAIEAREAALRIWRASGAQLQTGDALRWLSRLEWFAGRRAPAERYAAEAVAVLEALPPGPELAMAYSNLAQLEMLANHARSAIELSQRTIALAEPAGQADILCHALNNLGTARLVLEDDGGRDDLQRSLALALEHGFQEHAARAYTNLCTCAVNRHRYAEADAHLAAGLRYCEERDLDSWGSYMLAWRARAHLERGDWDKAGTDADALVDNPSTAPITRIPALVVLGTLRARRGDATADSAFEEAARLAAATGELQRLGPIGCARADAAWLAGENERIAAEVRPAYELAAPGNDPWKRGAVVVWLWRAGELTAAPRDVAPPYLQEMTGDWRGAADAWRALGCPYEQATVLAWHGAEAERLQALAIAERLGAGALSGLLRRQLRASGVRNVPRGSRKSTRSHPQGLTRREAQVLQLLADGLANARIAKRLFVSPKTVEHHVSAILAKLGVPSRAEAVALARRRNQDA